jgi:xylulokinase
MGGGSRSPLWTQIVADVTGRTVQLCGDDEISARGAAVLAAASAGVGVAAGLPTAERIAAVSTSMAAPALARGARRTPDASRRAAYEALFAVYAQLYPALRTVFADLQQATTPVTAP